MSLLLRHIVSTTLKWIILYNLILIIGYVVYYNQKKINEYAITELSETTTTIPNDTVNFYIFWNFSSSIQEYFKSCHESNLYGRHRLKHWANAKSHFGDKYFSMDGLRKHKWYDPQLDINDAEFVIVPIPFTLAANGYCRPNQSDHHYYYSKNNKPFLSILDQLFTQLYQLQSKQKILMIAHDFWMCHIDRYMPMPSSAKRLGRQSRLVIGHYENRELAKHRPCFWQTNTTDKQEMANQMIIVPYTIPFKYTDYSIYDNITYNLRHFQSKRYKLFFMGGACYHITRKYDRLIAMNHLRLLNHVNANGHFEPTSTGHERRHMGVITDFEQCHIRGKTDYTVYTRKKLPICNASLGRLEALQSPCGLNQETYDRLNGNNELYTFGLKHSQFNLMIHGDTPTSGKFYDSIAFNLINIIIGMNKDESYLYLPFTDIVPYEKFVFFVNTTRFREHGLAELMKIVYETPEQQIQEMISYMTRYKRYLLWDHKDSLVVDSIMRQAKNQGR
eukprot:499_1